MPPQLSRGRIARGAILMFCVACSSHSPPPATAPTPTPTPSPAPQPQMRVMQGARMVTPRNVAVRDVPVAIAPIDTKSTCHVLGDVPIPGVSRMLTLRFEPDANGARNISVGVDADGTPVRYSDARGDIVRRANEPENPMAHRQSISLDLRARTGTMSHQQNGAITLFRFSGDAMLTAPNLGDPATMMAHVQRECAGQSPRAATMVGPGQANATAPRPAPGDVSVAVRRVAVADLVPLVPDEDGETTCTASAAAEPGVTRSLTMQFRRNGILTRRVIVGLGNDGSIVQYTDFRGIGRAAAMPSTRISIDVLGASATVMNEALGKPPEMLIATGPAVLTAATLGNPRAMMERVTRSCSGR